MNWERALANAAVGRAFRRVVEAAEPLWRPIVSVLARVDTWLVSLVRGSRLYAWATAEPEPDPVVIDLRASVLFAAAFRVHDRLANRWRDAGLSGIGTRFTTHAEREPVRTVSLLIAALFSTSLLASTLGGEVTPVTYGLHAAILCGCLLGLRERRGWETLRETAPGRVLRALFAPPER